MVDFTKGEKFFKKNAAAGAEKLVEKYNDAIADGLTRLKDPATIDAWQTNVSSDKTKQKMQSGVNKLTPERMKEAMKDKGKAAFTRTMGLDSTAKRWRAGIEPYGSVIDSIKADKKPITSDQDRIDNMTMNMERMMKKKAELDGSG
jgi:hypothetical protein